jgi:predicted RecA/RadA family phage recombinase
MAKNFIAQGKVFDYLAAGIIASGSPVIMTDVVGVATNSGVAGDIIPVAFTGVFEVAKDGNAITIGEKLYWDPAANGGLGWATGTAGALKLMGYAYLAAIAGAATVQVRLIG